MARYRVSSTKQGSNEQIKDEIDAHFFYSKDVVHKEFVPPGQTVNAAFYVEVLKRLKTSRARPPGDRQHLGSSPRQSAEPCVAASERVSGETNRGNAGPASLQPRPGPARFLFVSPAQIQLERTLFCEC